ncbi:methyltransferase [Apiospora saccharicola]
MHPSLLSPMDRSLSTEIVYFSRDKRYDTEKPYTTSFPVDQLEGAKIDNHQFDHVPVTVHDMRGCFTPNLNTNGFCFVDHPTTLDSRDFDDVQAVTEVYFAELADMFKKHFPQYRKISFVDQVVRRRLPDYPAKKGTVVPTSQPFRYAHVDFTEHGALLKLSTSLNGDVAMRLGKPKKVVVT